MGSRKMFECIKIVTRTSPLRCCRRLMLSFSLLLVTAVAMAQVDQGTISGIVQDSSGAVVPNAQITITDVDPGLSLQTTSNRSGIFVVSPLKIGNYKVSAVAPGFATVE